MFTRNIKQSVLLGKSGVRWMAQTNESPTPQEDSGLTSVKNELKWLLDTNSHTDSNKLLRALDRIREGLQKLTTRNQAQKTAINTELDKALADSSGFSHQAKEEIKKLKDEFARDFKEAEGRNQIAKVPAQVVAKAETNALKMESIYNSPLVKDYAHRINLGSAIALLNNQTGANTKAKAEAALRAVKESNIAYNSQSEEAPKTLSGYEFRTNLNLDAKNTNQKTNSLLAIEADKLQDFYSTLIKATPEQQNALLGARIDTDREVDVKNLADMIADFDDDGILESVNGVDTSSWGKWFFSLFGSADAMQTQFFGEIQLKKILDKNLGAITTYLGKAGITRGTEDDKTWAKRVRTAITLQADMFGTGKIGAEGAKDMYAGEAGKKNLSERKEVEQILSEVEKSLKASKANIKPEDLSKVARQMTDWIIRTQLSFGGGSVNLTEIKNIVALDEVRHLLAIDYSAFLKLFNSTRFKANASAGVGLTGGRVHLLPLAHIGANAKLTFADRGDLENLIKNIEEGKSNVTATLGANIITKVSGPAINVDLLWKDRIDQAENAGLHMAAVIDDMMTVGSDGTPLLDLNKIEKKNMHQSLRDMLSLLAAAITEGAVGLKTPQEKQAHAVLMRNKFLSAFDLYLHNHPNLKGVGLAGITLGAMPGAFAFGPVFQNLTVKREAYTRAKQILVPRSIEQYDTQNSFDAVLRRFGVTYDSNTRTFTLPTNSKAQISIDAGITNRKLGEGMNPVLTVDGDTLNISQEKQTTKEVVIEAQSAAANPLKNKSELPSEVLNKIHLLDINTLFGNAKVIAFLKVMTQQKSVPTLEQKLAAANAVPVFKAILDSITESNTEKKNQYLQNTLDEIDSKFIGDWVTRMYTHAKTDANFFPQYKQRLANLGVDTKNLNQNNMTLGVIENISFNKKNSGSKNKEGLRLEDAQNIAQFVGSPITQEMLLGADANMLNKLRNMPTLPNGVGTGLMLMSRNRMTPGLQGIRRYLSGSYMMKEDLPSLTVDQKIAITSKVLGDDFKKMILENVANRSEFSGSKDEISKIDPTKINIDNSGKATIKLSNARTLTIDVSSTKVYSALFGDTRMQNNATGQAVCVNLTILVEPSVSAIISAGKKTEGVARVVVNNQKYDTINEIEDYFPGRPVGDTLKLVGTVSRKGNEPEADTGIDNGGGDGGDGDGGDGDGGGGGRR